MIKETERHCHSIFIFSNERLKELGVKDNLSVESAFLWMENEIANLIQDISIPVQSLNEIIPERKNKQLFCTNSKALSELYSTIWEKNKVSQINNIDPKPENSTKFFLDTTLEDIQNIGFIYYNRQLFDKALKWLEFAAEEGCEGHENLIGMMYEEGLGVNCDKEKAFEWYMKAAEAGNAEAQFNVGHGCECQNIYIKAFDLYLECGKQGNIDALCNLGDMYENGIGVIRNNKLAFKYFMHAAKKGTAYAQYKVACMYDDVKDAIQDIKQAYNWYIKADNQNYAAARIKLIEMYDRGYLSLSRKKIYLE